jgi:ParB family chromosome partitioning protein
MSRADQYLARACGNTLWFLPGDITLVADKTHPLYDERVNESVDRDMVDSIKMFGVLQPPIVTRQIDDDGKPYMACVVGRQRFGNAIIAAEELKAEGKLIPGKRPGHIECILRTDFTPEELREVVIHENAKRKEETLKTKIGKAIRLLEAYKVEADTNGEKNVEATALRRVAGHFGVTATVIKRWVEVPKLAPAARKAVLSGAAALGLVDDLKDMSAANQETAVARAVASPTLGTRGAKQAAAEIPRAEKMTRRSRKVIVAEVEALTARLADPSHSDPIDRARTEGRLAGIEFAHARVTKAPKAAKRAPKRMGIAPVDEQPGDRERTSDGSHR